MNAFSRSWEITKLSFGVIRADKELLVLPVLSTVFSTLYVAALVVPSFFFGRDLMASGTAGDVFVYSVAAMLYLGLAFVATFFNTCTVYTAKTRFQGGDATLADSLAFGMSRIPQIFMWSVLAATVGTLLRMLEQAAERAGGGGRMLLNGIQSMLGLTWSVVTLFVVPAMVLRDVGPIDAVKHSSSVLRQTWGESLIRYFGLGAAKILGFVGGGLVFFGLLVTIGTEPPLSWIIMLSGALYMIAITVIFSVADTVFNTALFVYADTGTVPNGYDDRILSAALRAR